MDAKITAAVSANRRLWIALLILVASAFLIKEVRTSSSAQSPELVSQDRKFKLHREYKNFPLAVRTVRNLQSENWHKDLEIEVKNVGNKAIFCIVAYVLFPDDKQGTGEFGIPLMFGNPENTRIRRYADPEDPHLDPDGTYVFKVPEDVQEGFRIRAKGFPERYKKLELWFEIISFGDGTGLINGDPRDYRKKLSIAPTLDRVKKSRPLSRANG